MKGISWTAGADAKQQRCDEMQRILVGLIGANIQKSLSPALHEDACAEAGLRGHYHLMDLDLLPGRTLESLLHAVRTAGFAGTNVTYPCKEAVLPLLDEVSPEARQIGAVNTVTVDWAGRACGYNTDHVGFRRAFEETFGGEAARGQTVLLVGAGGAGRAVAFALLDLAAEAVLVYDTDTERAGRLAEELRLAFGASRGRAVGRVASAMAGAAGVVNATPVGMVGLPGIPVPLEAVARHHWVADVIYTPLETSLIAGARTKGCRVMGGAAMCVHQAAESFRLFTGRAADVSRMRRIFVDAAAAREPALDEGNGAPGR
jgi:shikimate dehydrogenase